MDFYSSVNRDWLEKNNIPDDYQRWGCFEELHNETQNTVKNLVEQNLDTLYGRLYSSGMNVKSREDSCNSFLVKTTNQLFDNFNDLGKLFSRFYLEGISTPLSRYVSADAKNSEINVAHLCQGGLGLPDRDYYLLPDKEKEQKSYQKYLSEIFIYIKKLDVLHYWRESIVTEVYQFEEQLAKIQLSRTERRDPVKTYNPFNPDTFKSTFTGIIQWRDFFNISADSDSGLPQKIIVESTEYLSSLLELLQNTDPVTLKYYLLARTVHSFSGFLNTEIYKMYFEYASVLTGQKEPKPLWKRVINTVETLLGEPLGKDYVEKYFPESSKEKMVLLVKHLIQSYRNRLQKVDWMGSETKQLALKKLDAIRFKVGYPDKWRDYSLLVLPQSDYITQYLVCHEFEARYEWSKIDTPVDKTQWEMNPHEINAYYHPTQHEIVFPAGILQSPFFDPNNTDAENYGGIGAVIGHEITHGFDDQGRQYDSKGNLDDWWTTEDSVEFNRLTERLKTQYSEYPVEDVFVNGELTLGENIADLGGLTIAYYAWKQAQTEKENPDTDSTLIFQSWAKVWRNLIRSQEAKRLVVIDPHSPGKYRVNGVIKNMPEYYQAYGLPVPNDCIKIW